MVTPDIGEVLRESKRIAVVGMRESGPAGSVPRYMQAAGYEIIPVNPDFGEVLGIPALDNLDDLDQPVDIVNLFRRSEDVPMHLGEILRAKPKYVWMQSGIRNDTFAQELTEAGIGVVQDRCLRTEHRRLFG